MASQYSFAGCVDRVQLYRGPLSAAQVMSLFQAQFVTSAPTPTPTPSPTPSPTPTTSSSSSPVPLNYQASSGSPGSNGIGFTYNQPVMSGPSNRVYLLFYGSWSPASPAYTLLPDFINNLGGSTWWNTATTYFSQASSTAPRTYISNTLTLGGAALWSLDPTMAAASGQPAGTSLTDSNVYTLLKNAVLGGAWGSTVPDSSGLYMLLTSSEVVLQSGFCTSYCGWHTAASLLSRPFRYGVVGDPSVQCPGACSAGSKPNGDAATDAMASTIAHELVETCTDPYLSTWQSSGTENADKCAWRFGTTYTTTNGQRANVKLSNGRNYLIQQNWVNDKGGYCATQVN